MRERGVALRIAVSVAILLPFQAAAQSPTRTTLQLGTAASGVIDKIFVRDGDHVEAGKILLKLDCRPLEAEIKFRGASLQAADAVFARVRNGSRPDEIAIGEANVGVAVARAEEAQAAFERATALREGVATTHALVLQARRDARITAAQLDDAKKKLDLLHAGSRQEDVDEAQARRDAASAFLDEAKAQLEQCFIHAPAAGTVKVLATPGQYVSTAVPTTLLQLTQDNGS